MPLNAKTIRETIELYTGEAGVNRSRINPKLVRQMINLKLQEWSRKTGTLSSKIRRSSVASQQEYELGQGVIHVTKVNYDGAMAYKIRFEEVDEIKRLQS